MRSLEFFLEKTFFFFKITKHAPKMFIFLESVKNVKCGLPSIKHFFHVFHFLHLPARKRNSLQGKKNEKNVFWFCCFFIKGNGAWQTIRFYSKKVKFEHFLISRAKFSKIIFIEFCFFHCFDKGSNEITSYMASGFLGLKSKSMAFQLHFVLWINAITPKTRKSRAGQSWWILTF